MNAHETARIVEDDAVDPKPSPRKRDTPLWLREEKRASNDVRGPFLSQGCVVERNAEEDSRERR